MHGKVTALGVLCCFALFVCLTLLAFFFLPSHLSFKNMHTCMMSYILHCFQTHLDNIINIIINVKGTLVLTPGAER